MPIYDAIKVGNLNRVRWFIEEKNIDPNTKNKKGYALLYYAVMYGHLEIVRYLIEKGADMYAHMVIQAAVFYGHLEIVRYLIEELKFDPNIQDRFWDTLVQIALKRGHNEIAFWLLTAQSVNCRQTFNK